MGKKITVLHLADIHLDTPFAGYDGEEASKRNAEIRAVFGRAMRYASEIKADIVLLAGDIFDREYCSAESGALLKEAMLGLPSCRFIISPGNHDPYNGISLYREGELPENCYIFREREVQCFSFPEINTDVYGYAFVDATYEGDPLDGFRVRDPERLNLLCAHCLMSDNGGAADGMPILSPGRLSESGIDYAALGHIHGGEGMVYASEQLGITASMPPNVNTLYAYSGCIAGRDFGECGKKGGVVLRAEIDGNGKDLFAERKAFCPWVYCSAETDLSGAADVSEMVARVRETVSKETESGFRNRIRITLTGAVSDGALGECTDIAASIKGQIGAENEIVIKDETVRAYGISELDSDYTVKGVFYRLLKDKLSSDDEQVRSCAAFALELGLCALDGGNPWDIDGREFGE